MDAAPPLSLRHVALKVTDLAAAERFFVDILGYQVEWRPDADNVYLRSAGDNLALHRAAEGELSSEAVQRSQLDHIGFMVPRAGDVDAWAARLSAHGVQLAQAPKTHRDGARSLYVRGPEGTLLQIIHHPPIGLK